MNKAWIIVRKEWAEVFKNRFVLFTVAFMPLLLTAIPLVILYFGGNAEGGGIISMSDLPSRFEQLCTGMGAGECAQYYLVSQFMLMFMLIPLMIPVTIGSYSIVGEKRTRTLEPLLATPISTLELLAGKALSATLPAVAATWGAFAVFAVGARLLAVGPGVIDRLMDPLWLMAVFVLGPLLSLAGVSVAVMISSRVNDPRVAEQMSMFVILPLLGLFFAQILGFVFLSEQIILWLILAMAVIDVGLLTFAIQIFQRESILTRWK